MWCREGRDTTTACSNVSSRSSPRRRLLKSMGAIHLRATRTGLARRRANRATDELPTDALGRRLHAMRRHRARATATYHRLLEDVKKAGGLASKNAAETALLVVAAGISRRIPRAEATHLLGQLSSITRDQLAPFPEKPDREITVDMIESQLCAELHVSRERATNLLGSGLRGHRRARFPRSSGLHAQEPAGRLQGALSGSSSSMKVDDRRKSPK